MRDSDESTARAIVGSLINGLALGLLLSYVGQIYFNQTGFLIGGIVGFLLSVGTYIILSTIYNERKPQPK